MSNPRADPGVLVIFGASGDLARRKLLPAVYNLAEAGLLPEPFAIAGVARPPLAEDANRTETRAIVEREEGEPLDPALWEGIGNRLHYISGELNDAALYERLKTVLADIGRHDNVPPNYLFYLAIPPELFATVGRHLAASGLAEEREGWRRVVVEKPFGYDLESARRLNAELTAGLRESQIYRIDHYLGKETVQNILAFRFANGIFEPIWNRGYIDHVQITVAETVGVEQRGGYYESAGALRDMVQNHMFQLLAFIAMEPPISFAADMVRDERVKVLYGIRPLSHENVLHQAVRGQYGEGLIDGHPVPGYREEKSVAPTSATETFAALKLHIDNWRWADVPFYLRTGKRLPKHETEITIQFKRAPYMLFRKTLVDRLSPNRLVLHIQPDEGISLRFGAKVPG